MLPLALLMGFGFWLCCKGEFGNSYPHLPPVTQRNVNLLEVLVSKM